MGSDYDLNDQVLIINGVEIDEFEGIDNLMPAIAASANQGAGGKRYGTNKQRGANGIDPTFRVRQTTGSKSFLFALMQNQEDCSFTWKIVHNQEKYKLGELIECNFSGVINPGGDLNMGGEATDMTFQIVGILSPSNAYRFKTTPAGVPEATS